MQNAIVARLSQGNLKALLDKAHGAVGRTHPYFLLEFFLTRVTCSATDLKIGIVAELPLGDTCSVDMGGVVCVPANKFRNLIAALHSDSPVILTGLENNRLHVECGDYSGVVACVDPAVHFPSMDVPSGDVSFTCYGDLIQTIHAACCHAIYPQEGVAGSIYFRADNGSLLGVALDGHRLSLAAKALETVGGKGLEKGVMVSSRVLSKIGLLSPYSCEIRIRENHLSFEQVNFNLIGRLLEGEYPDFRKAIPTEHPHCCVVKAREMIERVERVMVLAESDYIMLDICPGQDDNGDIQIGAESAAGACQDLVSAEVRGYQLKVRVSPRHLLDALRSLAKDTEDVIIKYSTDYKGPGKDAALVMIPADHGAWNERIEIVMPRGN